MIRKSYVLPVAILAGIVHLVAWWSFTNNAWVAAGTSLGYGLLVFVTYKHLAQRSE